MVKLIKADTITLLNLEIMGNMNKKTHFGYREVDKAKKSNYVGAVSYTHLTLPTIDPV